ncbi:TPA: NAD(P)H-dependent oxidoreductase [Streptococcus agalactiae]|nr:NAD(P)H-dependent oxidoreductase [Streptococcus agalactiae]HEO3144030.1 NAD(P)H-dependent oxidoreductase [Streptococcus agalactiae]
MTKEDIKKQVRRAFDFRMAIRVYNNNDIPKEDMEYILDTAWLSPSSVGLEGWRFLVLDRQTIAKFRDKLKEVAWGAQYQLDTASHFVLLLAEKGAYYNADSMINSLVRRGLGDPAALESRIPLYKSFQENDMKIDSERSLWDWTAKQTYIALGNMMTAAAMIGVDSCPIERFDYEKVNNILSKEGLIDDKKEAISCMVSFGYRLREPKHSRARKERQEVITWVE